ncbi:hypothetical protein ACCO45_010329 [Purpureocillium lilacinum]|uniref:Uncharacterized protein n=1 Tax=Purpureocillium lilacinum TaxID=33203 RepID=A0ACC4DEJ3_PURLI
MCEHLKSHSLASMDLEAVARSGPTGGYGHRRQGRLGLQWFQLPLIPAGLRRSAGNGRPGGNPGAGTWPVPKLARRTRVAANAGVHPTATKARPPNHGRLPPLPARAVRAPDCPPAPARDPPMGEEELQDPPQPPPFPFVPSRPSPLSSSSRRGPCRHWKGSRRHQHIHAWISGPACPHLLSRYLYINPTAPSPLPDVAAAATHTALHRQEPLASLANDRHRHRLSCPVAPPLAYRNGNEAHGQAGPKSCGAPFTKGTRTNNR